MTDRSVAWRLSLDAQGVVEGARVANRAFDSISNEGIAKTHKRLEGLERSVRAHPEAWQSAGVAAFGFGTAVAAGFGLAGRAAMTWESDWAGVTKTVDGTERQMSGLESGLRRLAARELPATSTEIAGVAEAAGQLGIQTGNVLLFTKTMINMGESTNLSADEAASGLARFSNIMGTNQKDIGRLGASIVGLGNNFATTEREILDMAMRIAGAGRQAHLSEGDVLGLATALSSVGIEAEAGGTAISMVMKKMGNEVASNGDKMSTFARISGMSSQQFSQAWRDDAAGALQTFIAGLGEAQTSGENVNATLSDLGITGIRESDALLRLSGASDVLKDALATGNDEYVRGIALMEEANKRYDTAESRVRIAGNAIKDASIGFGDVFLPAVADAADGIADFANFISGLPAPVKELGLGLAGTAGATSLAAGGFLLLAPKVFDVIEGFKTLKADNPAVVSSLGEQGKAALIAAGAIGTLQAASILLNKTNTDNVRTQSDLTAAIVEMSNATRTSTKNTIVDPAMWDAVNGAWARISQMDWFNEVNGWGDALHEATMSGAGFREMATSWTGADTQLKLINEQITETDKSLADLASQGSLDAAQQGFRAIAEEGVNAGVSLEDTFAKFPEFREHVLNLASAANAGTDEATLLKIAMGEIQPEMLASSAVTDEQAQKLNQLGVEAKTSQDNIKDLADEIRNFGSVVLDERSAAREFEQAYDDANEALKENGKTLDITTQKGRDNEAALDRMTDSARQWAGWIVESSGSTEAAQKKIDEQLRPAVIEMAKSFGYSGTKAEEYADSILAIPDDASTSVKTNAADATRKTKDAKAAVGDLDGDVANVKVNADTKPAKDEVTGFRGWFREHSTVTMTVITKIQEVFEDFERGPSGKRRAKPGDSIKGNIPKVRALGGIDVKPMADGGMLSPVAQMVPPNTWRLVGDRLDVDEAFIPLDGSRRSWKILTEAMARMPGTLPMAAGAVVSGKPGSDDAKRRAEEQRRKDEERRKEERERQARIRDLRDELYTDLRRGNVRDQVTGGLSGAYSAVDRLKGLSTNDALSSGARRRAGIDARGYEKSLRSLYKSLETLESKTDKAKEKLDELKQIQSSVASSISNNAFKLELGTQTEALGDGNFRQTSGVGHMRTSAATAAGRVKDLAGKLKQLQKKGYGGAILREVAQAGSIDESLALANALLQGTSGDVSSLNASYADIEKYSNQAGAYVTEGFYQGGVNAAAGLVKGLESQQKTIEKTIEKIAKGMEGSLRRALGIKSPSTVMYARGVDTVAGLDLALLDGVPRIEESAAALGLAAVPPVVPVDPFAVDPLAAGIGAEGAGGLGTAFGAPAGPFGSTGGEEAGVGTAESWETTLATTEEALTAMQAMTAAAYLQMTTDTEMSLLARQEQTALAMTSMLDNQALSLQTMQETQATSLLTMQTNQATGLQALVTNQTTQMTAMETIQRDGWARMNEQTKTSVEALRSGVNSTMIGMNTDLTGTLGTLSETASRGFDAIESGGKRNFEGLRSGIDAEMGKTPGDVGGSLNATIGILAKFAAEVNKAFKDVGVKLPSPNPLKFADGGVMPGYTPGRDVHEFYSPTGGRLALSGGEAFMVPEFTKSVGGEKGIRRLNREARAGRLDPEHLVQHFADGGVWRNLWAMTREQFPNARLTSAYRPGSITASGNLSHHARGNAIDVSPSMSIFDWWHDNYGADLAELIFSPAGGRQIKNGKHYTYQGAVKAQHWDHVHIAAVRALSDAMASGLPGAGGFSHPFLDKAGIDPGADLAKAYAEAAKKLTEEIYGKLAPQLPSGIGGQLGKGVMSQISEGLIDKAREFGKNSGMGDFSGVANGPIKQMAKQMLEAMGWGDQFGDLDWLLTRESGWNPTAQNPTSSAYGLFQFLNGTWDDVGGTKTSDPRKQLEYGLKYIRQRYRDVRGARRFWESHNWYIDGTTSARPGPAVVGEDGYELVRYSDGQWARLGVHGPVRTAFAGGEQVIPHQQSVAIENQVIRSSQQTIALDEASVKAIAKSGEVTQEVVAAAMNGMKVTIMVDGQQMTGFVQATVGDMANKGRRAH